MALLRSILRNIWLAVVGCVLLLIVAWGYFYAANSDLIPSILPFDLIIRKPLNRLLSDWSEQVNNSYANGGPRKERRVYATTDIKAGTVIQPNMVEIGEYQGPPSCPCPTSTSEVIGRRTKFDLRIGQHIYSNFVE